VALAALVYPAGHFVNTVGVPVLMYHPGFATEQTETSPVHDVHPSIVVQSVQAVILSAVKVLANPALHFEHVSTAGVPATVHVSQPAIAQAVQVAGAAGVVVLAVNLNPDLQALQSSVMEAKAQVLQLPTPHASHSSGFAFVSKAYPSRHSVGTANATPSQVFPPVVKPVQTTQAVDIIEPAGEPLVASHATQSVTASLPVVVKYVPAGQFVQAPVLLSAAYLPAPQIVHAPPLSP